MGISFQLLWWIRTGQGLVCQLPGTIGVMSGQGNMALLGLYNNMNPCSTFCRSFILKRHSTLSLAPNMFVMAFGWITLQPFVPPFN